jgi:hypothetical protein
MEELLSSFSRLAGSFVEERQILLSHFSTTNSERWESSNEAGERIHRTETYWTLLDIHIRGAAGEEQGGGDRYATRHP